MAVIYCRSTDGADGDSGLTWALAKATLAAALTAAGAGGTVYVSQAHAETAGAQKTLASPGTFASPVTVICVSDAAEPPTARATTGAVSTTGNFSIVFSGCAYCYGITFTASSGGSNGVLSFSSSTVWWWRLERCVLVCGGTGSGTPITIGNQSVTQSRLELISSDIKLPASASASIWLQTAGLIWRGGAYTGSTTPTTLFTSAFNQGSQVALIEGVDLSGLGTSKNLVNAADAAANGSYTFVDCKLGATPVLATGTYVGRGGISVEIINCDSADTQYRYAKTVPLGTIVSETVIVKTSGASDGTTTVSRKMVSGANTKIYSPLESSPILYWNETTGSAITITVPIISDNVTFTDAEVWIEAEYLGTSGAPLGAYASDRMTDLTFGTPVNQTTDSSTWTTTGLTTPVKQQLSVTFTPQEKGLVRARVMLGKASSTMYFDPLLVVS